MKKLLFLVAAATVLAGCGQKAPSPTEEQAATSTPAAPSAEAANAAPPTSAAPSDAEIEKTAAATQESAGTSTPAAADSVERVVGMPASTQLPGGRWKAGTHYLPLSPSQATSVNAGEVEVIEFLWLACGACYQANGRIAAWKAKLPAWVKFRQEHVVFGDSHRRLARLLYTLEVLKRDDLVAAAFEEIHRKGNMLVAANDAKTLDMQLAFAKANGISEADFKREFNGFAVNSRLQRAEELDKRYRITHTPMFFVNGKYQTDINMAGGHAELLQLLDDLAAFEKR
jgi:protein dithiol oxidoreductase (disulfide-forming)